MNTLINLAAKWSGLGWVWEKTDGYKSKIAGTAAVLTGLGGVLMQVVPILSAHDFAALLNFAKGLPSDPSWAMLIGGLATFGIAHKVEKAADPSK